MSLVRNHKLLNAARIQVLGGGAGGGFWKTKQPVEHMILSDFQVGSCGWSVALLSIHYLGRCTAPL